MIIDAHIHITDRDGTGEDFQAKLKAGGVDAAAVFSLPPNNLMKIKSGSDDERLDYLFEFTGGAENIYPVFFLDPWAPDAKDQVHKAVDRGVMAFKIIATEHDPCEGPTMDVYREIAAAGKPIFFHSGILYSLKPWSIHSRPILFEPLIEIEGLRFSLAHISWPWMNECVALFGHAFNRRWQLKGESESAEMFVDTTPGAPRALRQDALMRCYANPQMPDKIFWGTDGHANRYSDQTARDWIAEDKVILDSLGLDADAQEQFFSGNLLRFLGVS